MTLIIPDPRWEEPNLLIPGRKPVGPVTIAESLKPTQCWLFGGNYGLPRTTISGTKNLIAGKPQAVWSGIGTSAGLHPGTVQGANGVRHDDTGTGQLASKYIYLGAAGEGRPAISDVFTSLSVVWVGVHKRFIGAGYFILYGAETDQHVSLRVSATGEFIFTEPSVANHWVTAAGVIQDLKFCTIGVTYDGNTARLFVDGVLKATGTFTASFVGSTGQWQTQNGNDGLTASITVFDRALPVGQMQSLTADPYQFLIPA